MNVPVTGLVPTVVKVDPGAPVAKFELRVTVSEANGSEAVTAKVRAEPGVPVAVEGAAIVTGGGAIPASAITFVSVPRVPTRTVSGSTAAPLVISTQSFVPVTLPPAQPVLTRMSMPVRVVESTL